jgi:ATP-dependent Lhr-like helicase
VGNPDELLGWLVGRDGKTRTVVQPPAESTASAETTLDFVGSLENAATVISRLHRGEKRLVFCDSRSRVESLAGLLRSAGVQAFVSHSSLSAAERRRAEEAFARGEDCVIVATSTLELGIDVGDLDRVIQIDAPARVASFLQRLGRTGRRTGKSRNCLFLCTNEHSLLRGAALLHLWQQGYVEPIVPPPIPYHIVAQQTLALCLESGGMGKNDLLERLRNLPPAREMNGEALPALLAHMLTHQILSSDGVRYFIGEEGEKTFGRRNFLELVSVFTSAPVLVVTDGKQELGVVDQNLFFSPEPGHERLLSLAGRGWRVESVDWKERRVFVTPTELLGKTTWFGSAAGLSLIICRAIRTILVSDKDSPSWSQRAKTKIAESRAEYCFLKADQTTLRQGTDERITWFTFGGEAVNLALAETCGSDGLEIEKADDYGIYFARGLQRERLESCLGTMVADQAIAALSSNEEAEKALKFAECVPADLLKAEVVARR